MTTPDQYRREGAEAMRAYIANQCDPAHLPRSDNPTEFHAGYRHAAIQRFTAIRAIDVDEVLARLPPAPDPVARLVEAGIDLSPWISASMSDPYNPACAEYLRVAGAFLSALAALETSHDHD